MDMMGAAKSVIVFVHDPHAMQLTVQLTRYFVFVPSCCESFECALSSAFTESSQSLLLQF